MFGIRLKYDGPLDFVPRVDGLIAAFEQFFNNPCGLIETIDGIVVGDEQSTQDGSSEVLKTENGATLQLAEGDSADFLRGVIIAARDAGTIKNHWVCLIPDGVTLSFTDPAKMRQPYDLAFAQDQRDYLQRLS